MRDDALQLARLLELAADEGSIPSRETLRKAAEVIIELNDMVEALSDDILGEETDLGEMD